MILKNLAKRSIAMLLMMAVGITMFAQTVNVTGLVTEVNGEPIIGASVMEVGTTNGTATDLDGKFTLKVKKGATLQVNSVGYTPKKVAIGNQTDLTIVLEEDAQTLDEFVAVGYGTMKKSDLTGAMGSMTGDKLAARGTTRVEDALQGSVPGLSITQSSSRANGGFSMQIRGQSSINKSGNPLFVVDGQIVSSIDFLNSADIERVDVLKDASSTAIYGSRASNGVIVITTKGGGSGVKKAMPVEVSYDGYYGIRSKARMPEFMDAAQWMDYRFQRFTILDTKYGKSGVASDGTVKYVMTDANLQSTFQNGTEWNAGPLYQRWMDNESYMWADYVLRTAHQQNHFVAANGSTEKVTYRLGMGYQSEENVFKNNDYWRINLKGAFDAKLSSTVEAGMAFNLVHDVQDDWTTESSNAFSPYNNAFWMAPVVSPWLEDGTLAAIPAKVGKMSLTSTPSPLVDFEIDPYTNQTRKFHIFGNAYLRFNIIPGLKFTTTFSPNYYHGRQGIFNGTGVSDEYPLGSAYFQNKKYNWAKVENTERLDWTWDNQIDYSATFDKHQINAMTVISAYQSNRETYAADVQNISDDKLAFWSLGKGSGTKNISSGWTESSLFSWAARANYTYDDRYLLTATIRTDGSSRFGKNYRWGWFPSVALGWRLSNEQFMESTATWLDNLKIRASYGTTGNNNVGDFVTASAASGPNHVIINGQLVDGYYGSGLIDQALVWEKIKEFDAGFDFAVFNSRLSGSFDFYSRNSDGQIMDATVPIETGETKITTNIGAVRNTGIEVALNVDVIRAHDFNWNIGLNFATNKSKITKLPNGDDITKAWFLGERLNVIYDYVPAGVITDQGVTMKTQNGDKHLSLQEVYNIYGGGSVDGKKGQGLKWYEGQYAVSDYNQDGKIDANDRQILGCTDPKWTGAITSNMTWNGWDFSFMIYTKQGQLSASSVHTQYWDYNDRGRQKIAMDYYIPAGTPVFDRTTGQVVTTTETHYGSMPYPNNSDAKTSGGYFGSSNFSVKYHDTSFWKVKNITLGYTFPTKWMEKIHVKHLRLYANILNPFCWSSYKGFDPEWADAGLVNGGPASVTYQFGVNLKF